MPLTKEDLVDMVDVGAPHVVILGAGASLAALPSGDRHGQPVPLMNDLPAIIGDQWDRLIEDARPPCNNFEEQFSWIRSQGKLENALDEITDRIHNYFTRLELPDSATIYDHLVLSLRQKDVIATFNWDPLLMQAVRRNRHVANLPDVRFLHGNVAFSTCRDHDILGMPGEECPVCNVRLARGQLFLPDYEKDYTRDEIIHRDWQQVVEKLTQAFQLTIFGYSGPDTDYNARKLILNGWKQTALLDFAHTEVVDRADCATLWERWREYIPHNDHALMVTGKEPYWSSWIARYPRRTGEAKRAVSFDGDGRPVEEIGSCRSESLAELQASFAELITAEPANGELQPR